MSGRKVQKQGLVKEDLSFKNQRQTKRVLKENSNIYLEFQLCDIILPNTSHLAFFALKWTEPSLSRCTVPSTVHQCGPAGATGKQVSRKPACTNTKNSFSLCKHGSGKKSKEKTQIIFLLTSSSAERRLLTRWRTGEIKTRKSNDNKASFSQAQKKQLQKEKECVNSVISSTFQSLCFRKCISGENSVLAFWLLPLQHEGTRCCR